MATKNVTESKAPLSLLCPIALLALQYLRHVGKARVPALANKARGVKHTVATYWREQLRALEAAVLGIPVHCSQICTLLDKADRREKTLETKDFIVEVLDDLQITITRKLSVLKPGTEVQIDGTGQSWWIVQAFPLGSHMSPGHAHYVVSEFPPRDLRRKSQDFGRISMSRVVRI